MLAGFAFLILIGSLWAAPNRFLMLPFALAGAVLAGRGREPAGSWLLWVPWLALLNLPLFREGGAGHGPAALYPSETVLLAGIAILLARGRLAAGWGGGGGWALAFGAWIVLAALPAWGAAGLAGVLRPWRLALEGWACFALGQRGGAAAARALGRSAGGAVLALAGLAGAGGLLMAGGGPVPRIGRLVGGSEMLAIHLTLLLPLALGAALDRDAGHPGGRLLAGLGAGLGVAALAVSFSRSGWVGGWAALLVVSGLVAGRERQRTAGLLLAGLLVVGLAAGAVLSGWLVPPGLPAAYGERLQSLGGGVGLLADRAREWRLGIDAVRAHPLAGQPGAPNCYNLMLQLAARSGLVVLLPFTALLVTALRGAARAWRMGPEPRPGVVAPAAGLLGAIAGLLLTGIGESSLGVRVMPLAMLVLGVAASLAAAAPGTAAQGPGSD